MRAYEREVRGGRGGATGPSRESAERVYAQIVGFSGFGFPKAHSAAFGLLAYQSTWLRVHYGPEFLCALLNEQPMGFYPPDTLVHEAQRRGIEVLPPDVVAAACCATAERRGRPRRAHGARLRERRARGGRARDRGGAGAGRAFASLGGPRGALRGAARRARAAGLGGGVRLAGCSRRAPAQALWRLGVAVPGVRGARRAPSWRCRWSRATRPSWPSSRRGSGCWPTTAPPA